MTASNVDLIGWCRAVLVALGIGIDPSEEYLVGPLAWAYAEGGWSANDATYNAWNTTLPAPGSHAINAVGVQAYPTLATGVAATVSTLRNPPGRYAAVLEALAGGTPDALARAVGASPWGTPTSTILASIPHARAVLGVNPAPPPTTPEVPTMTNDAFIRWAYRFTLYREVDPAGYEANMEWLAGGGSRGKVIENLQDSPEGVAAIAAQRKALGLA